MNKQFDLFQKMKIKEVCENISRMTYAYINPDTKQPTIVPSKHYKDILDQPVEVLVNDQVKKQFLNIMFKQMKTLKKEEPILFNQRYFQCSFLFRYLFLIPCKTFILINCFRVMTLIIF